MKVHSKIIAISVAAALSAVSAIPALALENEFHGMFRLGAVASNFEGSEAASYYTYNGSNMFAQTGTTAATNIRDQHPSNATFLDQRTRVMYIAKIDNDLKLVTQFEMNSRWGDSDYAAGVSGGGAIGTDAVNLRTKDVYLDYTFHPGSLHINSKVGLMYLEDNYKGVFESNDVAAAVISSKFGDTSVRVGFSRLADNGSTNYATATNSTGAANTSGATNPTPYNTNGTTFGISTGTLTNPALGTAGISYGTVSADWWLVDVKHKVNDKLTVGGSYYLLYSDIAKKLYGSSVTTEGATYTIKYKENVHMLGVNAQGQLGPVALDGFFLYQFGKTVDKDISAFTANLGAKSKLGPGTIKAEVIYMSGDDGKNPNRTNAFVTLAGEGSYMATDLMILARDNLLIMGRNNALWYDNNAGQGAALAWVGYTLPLTDRLATKVNAGYGAVSARNSTIVASSGRQLGTELNVQLPFKAKENLTITPRFAYAFLGDFYEHQAANGKTPDNPYKATIMMNLVF